MEDLVHDHTDYEYSQKLFPDHLQLGVRDGVALVCRRRYKRVSVGNTDDVAFQDFVLHALQHVPEDATDTETVDMGTELDVDQRNASEDVSKEEDEQRDFL